MKPVFHAAAVNGPFEDPCVYVKILRESRVLLFDAGDIGRLESGNIMKISDIFVSHMHIDHFIGIDMVIRTILRREEPIRIWGPEGIISCIEGKLHGYTWNLIAGYPIRIEVFEVSKDAINHSGFYAADSFRRVEHPSNAFEGILLDEDLFAIKALPLSHDIPVLAFSMEEDYHININKALLQERGMPVGPWLSEFKKAIRRGDPPDTRFDAGGKAHRLEELMPIANITRGQKISYVTDVSPIDENIEKLIPFVAGSDTIFCEAYFLAQDFDRALERHHLTASIAGRIAREAGVSHMEIMHVSPRYIHSADEIYSEVKNSFKE